MSDKIASASLPSLKASDSADSTVVEHLDGNPRFHQMKKRRTESAAADGLFKKKKDKLNEISTDDPPLKIDEPYCDP